MESEGSANIIHFYSCRLRDDRSLTANSPQFPLAPNYPICRLSWGKQDLPTLFTN